MPDPGRIFSRTAALFFLIGEPFATKGVCPVQMIWQHPVKSGNSPEMGETLAEGGSYSPRIIEELGIEGLVSSLSRELSGGEMQRFLHCLDSGGIDAIHHR